MAEGGGRSNPNVPVYEYVDINTQVFHVGSFRQLWLDSLPPDVYSFEELDEEAQDAKFSEEFGVPAETLAELRAICSVDSLKSYPDDEPPDTSVVPPDPQLACLRLRKRKQDYKNSLAKDYTGRHDAYTNEMELQSVGRKPADADNAVPEGEIVLTFNIVYPVIFYRFKYVRPHQTLQVLGSQKLAELRDAICCVSDLQVFGEFSSVPDAVPQFVSKDHYKSAFFYFEGVFYNDMRYPECRDISQTTREWAKTRDFPAFTVAKMEETTFYDLKVKIGYPYLYCHQGDCEHVVILTDIRLIHRDDCRDRKLYPLLTYKHRVVTRKCSVCHLYISRWITTNDSLAPMDPCLFCDQCFRLLHYDKEGNKIAPFKAYSYVDPGAFN
ncbi:snRNA-activating protein complex subunit 3 [Denticeps clupeoides]|uniref:snRNA-activating protein complex subunit 3 n=1 Tax=Denticeps clupeoides TaxID=299321 RepID=A0AAY4AQT7_9TELE|nr:snRNA-activating protein complex subunit 3 [Denticeps clupeoides]